MELPIVISNILEAVKATVMWNKSQLAELLKNNKVHISIIKGDKSPDVMVKVLPVTKPKPKPPLNPILAERLKLGKQMLKDNSDALYLFVLLERVKEYTDKLKLKNLTPEGLETVKEEFNTVIKSLNKVNNQLEKL